MHIAVLLLLPTLALAAEPEVIFQADFSDPAMPGWSGARPPEVQFTKAAGPDGQPALCIRADQPANGTLGLQLPKDKLAGKAIVLQVQRKADGVKTGAAHYLNAKAMISFQQTGIQKPNYSSTANSDFAGTFDWELHRYVVQLPEQLDWVSLTIGLQACTGTAYWSDLKVVIDPRFPNQAALDRFLAEEQRKAFEELDPAALTVEPRVGGVLKVSVGNRVVPRNYWGKSVRERVLSAVPAVAPPKGHDFSAALAQAFAARATQLAAGLDGLPEPAANDRAFEIASLHARVAQLVGGQAQPTPVVRKATPGTTPVSPLIFGNNINTQNLSAPYDSERGQFQDGFLERVRPMGITFLRYPGGCNADVFNWRDTIGPLDQRKEIVNYHNGVGQGIAKFGVDEYLRFCEQEGMTPLLTTAFLKDLPSKVNPQDHPNGIRHPFVFEYLKHCEDRVTLAADWVEYCNGAVDTPLGKLRAANGHPKPYGVKYWEIGNESYGPDPIGSCTAEEYAAAFPRYVKAMKAKDPNIAIILNGHTAEWNEVLLKRCGKLADGLQFHIYLTPRTNKYVVLEGQPAQITEGTRRGDVIPNLLETLTGQMDEIVGKRLPIIISEFGMGNARNREFMTSITSPVLVADMWRNLMDSPDVLGANKWCLFTGYWFSQVQGPTMANPEAPYYSRPEQVMHTIYARCRSDRRLAVDNSVSEGAKAIVFQRDDGYGVVISSRESVNWQRVTLDLPGAKAGQATCLMVTAGHPFLSNENDHELLTGYEFTFDYQPGQPLIVPSNSVMGLLLPRG